MINLLDLESFTKTLTPVTSPDYVSGKGSALHPEGLFSEVIFGMKDSPERRENFSFIDLNCKVLHPALYAVIRRLNRKILLAINKEESFDLTETGQLISNKDGEINGIVSIIDNFDKINFTESENKTRVDLIEMISKYRKKEMLFISKVLVIPAAYRDIEIDPYRNTLRVDPLNNYYVKIIRLSLQLQSMQSGEIYDVLSAKMNQFVLDLYQFLTSKLGKKQGLIRHNILGKRVDFTARGVITGGSDEIKVDEIGIPFRMLVKLYEPFVLHDLIKSGNVDQSKLTHALREYNNTTLSILTMRSLLTGIYKGDELTEELESIIKTSVHRVIQDKVVLAKRDPAINSESVQGFKPVMVDGNTIKVNILKCAGYNADFDGDTMAVYAPITKESIEEAKEKMITSRSPSGMNSLSEDFSKDVVIGIYSLTKDPNTKSKAAVLKDESLLEKMDIYDIISFEGITTTVGRTIFNRKVLPEKYSEFLNEPINKKKINAIANDIYKKFKKDVYIEFCHNVVKYGMKYYTLIAPSFTLDDLKIPPSIIKLKPQLENAKTPEEAQKIINQMEKLLEEYLVKTGSNLGLIGEAGGLKGGYGQTRQILVSKGIIQDSQGQPMKPISSSYSDGLTSQDYFNSGIGSRSGIIDRVVNTSDTGYLSRQLVYALQRVEADPGIKDCGTNRYFRLKVTPDKARLLSGRFVNTGTSNVPFDPSKHSGKVIDLRSPLYCLSDRICYTCYGELLLRNKTHFVGVLAGHLLGEPLTQTIMRTFHTGGSVDIKTVDVISEVTRILSSKQKDQVLSILKQKNSDVFSLEKGKIIINPDLYLEEKKDIVIEEKGINLKYGYFDLKIGDIKIEVTIDSPIVIPAEGKAIDMEGRNVVVTFPEKSLIFSVPPTTEAFSEQVKLITSMLSGKQPWRSSDHFTMKLNDFYQNLRAIDMIHIEILASNLLRDKGNPSYPARLNKNYQATIGSLKGIPALESWLQSLNFENINKSITQGLVYDRPEQETILERIVTGDL